MSADRNDRLRTTQAIALIARREISERLRAKSFYALTGLFLVVIIAIGVISRVAGDSGPGDIKVGVTESVPDEFEVSLKPVAELFDREVVTVPIGDAAQVGDALDDGEIDVAVLGDERQLVFADEIDGEVAAIVQQAWSSAQIEASLVDAGLSTAEVAEVLSPAPLEAVARDGDSSVDGIAVLTGTLTTTRIEPETPYSSL